nr:MAG TPA: hypothetical protein [Caudoviricetes sp.]
MSSQAHRLLNISQIGVLHKKIAYICALFHIVILGVICYTIIAKGIRGKQESKARFPEYNRKRRLYNGI